jgi:hypothetical protein
MILLGHAGQLFIRKKIRFPLHFFEKKIKLCKIGDDITEFDGIIIPYLRHRIHGVIDSAHTFLIPLITSTIADNTEPGFLKSETGSFYFNSQFSCHFQSVISYNGINRDLIYCQ